MKNLYTFLTLVFLFTAFSPIHGQYRLQVIDPDDWWWPFGEAGQIEEATISLEPKGLYTEVGMYLTISDAGMSWSPDMNLEIILDFNLPPGSIIHDSWLWMPDEDIIVKAEVLDISGAIQTYEEIVDRNRDPSILYQKDDLNYQIRIFPLPQGESRKIKISYLCPNNWTSDEVATWIPTDILSTSNGPIDQVKIIAVDHDDWKNPRLEGVDDVEFIAGSDPVYGSVKYANIPGDQLNLPIQFKVDAPFANHNYYVGKLEEAQDQFYQLAYLPPAIATVHQPRNYLFAFDYRADNTDLSLEQALTALHSEIKETLQPADNFNLAYRQNGQVKFIAEEWLSCTPENFSQYLELIDPDNGGHSIALLSEAVAFAKAEEEPAAIVLITNASELNNNHSNDHSKLIFDEIEDFPIQINILDFQKYNFSLEYDWDGVTEYESNNLNFYQAVSNYTQGQLYSIFQGNLNLWSMLDNALINLSILPVTYDLHTKMDQGFTYSRHNINNQNYPKPNEPFRQVGKFSGNFPMEIEFSALANGEFIYEEEWVNASNVAIDDTLTREMWMGNEIKFMEGNLNNNSDIQSIVNLSISERVLSSYTAFLALDLENGGEPCANCWEVGGGIVLIAVDEANADDQFSISAAPNPFRESTRISITLNPDDGRNKLEAISLFDAFGKQIKVLDSAFIQTEINTWEWSWDGTDNYGNSLPAGVYYLVLQTSDKPITLKLVFIN